MSAVAPDNASILHRYEAGPFRHPDAILIVGREINNGRA